MRPQEAQSDSYKKLVQYGIEPTLNRLLILDVLKKSTHPLAAKDVLDSVLTSHAVNRVTVYRILDLLADKGVINRVSTGTRATRYCANSTSWTHGHSHFHCTRCGEVKCIDNHLLNIDETSLLDALPMQISNIDLRLDGICESCRTKHT